MANQKLVTCHISWWIHSFCHRRHHRVPSVSERTRTKEHPHFHCARRIMEHKAGIWGATHPCMMRSRKLAKKSSTEWQKSLYCDFAELWRRDFDSSKVHSFSYFSFHSCGSRSASTRINDNVSTLKRNRHLRERPYAHTHTIIGLIVSTTQHSGNACLANRALIISINIIEAEFCWPPKHATHRQSRMTCATALFPI